MKKRQRKTGLQSRADQDVENKRLLVPMVLRSPVDGSAAHLCGVAFVARTSTSPTDRALPRVASCDDARGCRWR